MTKQYTTTEVAKRENVTRARITALARAGRITGCKLVGPIYLFDHNYTIKPAPLRPKPRKAELAKKGKRK